MGFFKEDHMRYILNSAVITAPGRYSYRLLTVSEAKAWLAAGTFTSTIGYAETALAAEALFGVPIPTNRSIITMSPGDEALVFRLVFPPGTQRISPGEKGNLSPEFILSNCEIGLLVREA
jgi:hypothetical protein